MANEKLFAEFKTYWQIAGQLVEKATKEQVSIVARILALQSAYYAKKYGELPLPKLFEVLKISEKGLELLRDGSAALVAVFAMLFAMSGTLTEFAQAP